MKDIDFDELDRAVSSVLEPADETPATPGAAPAASSPSVEKDKKADAVTVESAPTATDEPAPAVEPTPPAAKTPLAIKRRGQFMDVVHPSSDMTGKPGETPAAPTQKVNIQPISSSVEPEAPAGSPIEAVETTPEIAAPTEPVVVETPEAPAETVEPAPADRIWPDPLDVMQTQEEVKDPTVVAALEDTAVDPSSPADTVADPTEEEPAVETPFLPDTKVDKRPLDAFSAEETPVVTDAVSLTDTTAALAEPLPPELQPDVIAVEANPSDKSEVDTAEETPAADEKASKVEPGFNASIAQQYVAEENKQDENHSIFDTREYHQPITPVKTKKKGFPGWLAAILVILLLAGLGAAGGYFWFYYGI